MQWEWLTLLRSCWPSSRRSASWRSTGSRPPPCGRAAGGPRPSPSSSGGATTWGPARPRRGGRWGSCGRSPPGSGRPPAEEGGQREEGRRAGLSKAARAEPAEAVDMHEGVEVGGIVWGFQGFREESGRCDVGRRRRVRRSMDQNGIIGVPQGGTLETGLWLPWSGWFGLQKVKLWRGEDSVMFFFPQLSEVSGDVVETQFRPRLSIVKKNHNQTEQMTRVSGGFYISRKTTFCMNKASFSHSQFSCFARYLEPFRATNTLLSKIKNQMNWK